jgi:hypothetical protein
MKMARQPEATTVFSWEDAVALPILKKNLEHQEVA